MTLRYGVNTALAAMTEQIVPVLRRYGVTKAGIFGSFARSDTSARSDLDIVVELPEGSSLLDLVGLEQDLSDLLDIEVDAHTYRSLRPLIRDRILAEELRIL